MTIEVEGKTSVSEGEEGGENKENREITKNNKEEEAKKKKKEEQAKKKEKESDITGIDFKALAMSGSLVKLSLPKLKEFLRQNKKKVGGKASDHPSHSHTLTLTLSSHPTHARTTERRVNGACARDLWNSFT